MKICFINNRYGETAGGAERIIKTLSESLTSRGHQIKIIDCNDSYRRLISQPLWRRFFHHLFGFININAYRRMKRIMAAENFDVVWLHNITGFGAAALLALRRQNIIQTVHDIQFLHPSGLLMAGQEDLLHSLGARLYQSVLRRYLPPARLTIFPSLWLAKLYAQHTFFLTQSVLQIINPVERVIVVKEPHNRFTFLYLGQLEDHKGLDLLTKAFAQLDADVNLIIAGSGRLTEKLKQQNKDPRILLTGPFTDPYLYLAKADCLVIPSTCYENLPTVALEAARAEVPAIGSRLGGIGEAIGSLDLTFEPTEEALLEKLTWVVSQQKDLAAIAEASRLKLFVPTAEEYLKKIGEQADINW